ncbi:MAG: hypothetical protein FWF63_00465 [Fibromonadales bacterium]|nr:hypothetical protein [Fibromonadales bacterium]
MSTKTAIDLATLGAPDNDSEGVDCYISEKGIQAAPEAIRELEGSSGIGKYQATMYMDGVTYYIFERKIFNEKMEIVKARYSYFDERDFSFITFGSREEIPTDDYFEYKLKNEQIDRKRPIKTISYMTITNAELQFFNIKDMNTLDFKVSNNIVALFNCNILAFLRADNNDLHFIKNPIFSTKTPNDITDKFPMGILSLRSWSPVWLRDHYNAELGDRVVDLRDKYKPPDFAVLLSEESVFIYDKNTKKVLALRQIRRRMKSDNEYYPEQVYINQSGSFTIDENMDWKVIRESFGNFTPYVYLEYVNHLYLFDSNIASSEQITGGDNIYGVEWTSEQMENEAVIASQIKFVTPSSASTPSRVEFFKPLPVMHKIHVPTDYYHKIPFCQSLPIPSNPRAKYCELYDARRIWGHEIRGFWIESTANFSFTRFETNDTIEDVKRKIKEVLERDNINTPDNWEKIHRDGTFSSTQEEVNQSFLIALGTYVYEFDFEAVLKGISLSYHTQDYLWGQRSRSFSLGTKLFTNVNPYTQNNKTEEIEISKWREQDIVGNDQRKLRRTVIDDMKKAELATQTLSLKDSQGNLRILSLPNQETQEVTVEYKNAVYYTDVGSFNITPANNQYEVPSNISDKIIGLWGEDRDILFISSKSIERFNIADSFDVPLTFVRLEKTYDLLIDWSGINKRLDILTKEKGTIYLNGEKRIKAIFNESSRIAPDTVWKATDLRIIENNANLYVIDSQNRAFKQALSSPVFSLTRGGTTGNTPLLASNTLGIFFCDWESDERFSVEWTYRNERNILLGEITIRMAQFNSAMAMEKRTIELYKDGNLIRSRYTSNATVNFYKFGRGLSSKFKINLEGYLKEVVLTDTEGWQK